MGVTEATRVSLVGGFKADERKHVDPDSAKVELQLQRVAGSRIFTWSPVRGEFDRKGTVSTC